MIINSLRLHVYIYRWNTLGKKQISTLWHASLGSATPTCCMKWHIGAALCQSTTWTILGSIKASLRCGHNVEPLCEKGYRHIHHPLATLNNPKSRERGWYQVWEKRRQTELRYTHEELIENASQRHKQMVERSTYLWLVQVSCCLHVRRRACCCSVRDFGMGGSRK